jgi:hypothetical protein
MLFAYCSNLYHIDLLVLKSDGSQTLNNTFLNAPIKEIRVEGTIGKSISITTTALSIDSMKSIIKHLANYKGTSNESIYTVTFNAEALARLETEGATSPSGGLWTNYINELGWNY